MSATLESLSNLVSNEASGELDEALKLTTKEEVFRDSRQWQEHAT